MTRDELRQLVIQTLRTIAPEMDPASLEPNAPIRVQLDIDSMDALNFFIKLHERLGVDIPEIDYGRLNTVDECVSYLASKLE